MDNQRQLPMADFSIDFVGFRPSGHHHGCVLSDDDYTGFDVKAFRLMIQEKIGTIGNMTFLLLFFLVRGNNVSKILTSTRSKEATEKFRELKNKLNIKGKAAGNPHTVTLSRIAISFPELVATILKHIPEIPGAVSLADIRASVDYPEYPSVSRQPTLACFLPKMEKTSSHVLNVFLYVNMMISETINSSKYTWKNMNPAQKIAAQKAYQTKAFNSDLLSEEERVNMCNMFEIMVDGKYSDIWLLAADKAKAKLESKYGSAF